MLANNGLVGGGQPAMGGAPPAPPAGNAPSPSGTYYAPPSGSDQYAEQYTGAQNAYNNALIRYNQQRTGLLQQYGYAGDVDPTTGQVKNLRVDAGSTQGQLQQLLHQQALEDEAARNSSEDRGLFGGLANQAESELAYGHHGQTASLANTLLSNLSSLDGQQLDSKSALDQALWQLQHSAVTDAVNSNDFNPAAPAADTGGGPGAAGGGGQSAPVSHIGTIPTTIANRLVAQAIAKGEPVSEHGLGQMKSPITSAAKPAPAKAAPARYYTTKAEAKKAAGGKTIKFTAGKGYYVA